VAWTLPPSMAHVASSFLQPMTRLGARQAAALVGVAAFGLAAGLGVFTFGYARGASYLTNDPAACANCHVMSEHFAAWQKGSHHATATCNDCHTPHDLVGKYTTKALNGFWHSFYFTTGRYPDPLRITERNRRVTEQACRHCHQPIVDAIDPVVASREGAATAVVATVALQGGAGDGRPPGRGADAHADARLSCIRCHTYVGHWVR
jgi:cytochrome c nitrite reductase small subunit